VFANQRLNRTSNNSSGTTTDDRVAAPEDQVAVPEDTEAEWQHYNFFLDQLLGLISRGEEEAVSRVISVIRSGGSHREILDIIEQQSEIQPERNGSIKDVPRAWRGSKGGHETTPGSSA
jgi:hypothetical protein